MQVQGTLEQTASRLLPGSSLIEKMNPTDAKLHKLAAESLPHIACTSFRVPGQNGITARSMEFPLETPWTVMVSAALAEVTSSAPNNQPGLSWTSKYAYLGFGVAGVPNLVVEGMNLRGLTASAQSLSATVYPTVLPSQNDSAVAVSDFIAWILGNFASCEEVAASLGSIVVWGNVIPGLGEEPLHFALSDALGQNGVIEFLNGKCKYYNNPIGVLTNDPPFKFHQYNLQLYNHLQNVDPAPTTINGVTIPTQYSTGSYGMLGGFDAVSRFSKVAHIVGQSLVPQSVTAAQMCAWHILNVIDRPAGTTLKVLNGQNLYETTQWAVVRDHFNLCFDIRTEGNMEPQRLSLPGLLEGLTPGQQKIINLASLIPDQYAPKTLTF